MPKVTVAIPTYNRESHLRECLTSVLAQSFRDFEVVIFDNHSDYDVVKLARSFNDPRIRVVVNDTNIGALNNFNKIFRQRFASPYLVMFHDDDTMHPDLLAKELSCLEANRDLVFAVTDLTTIKNQRLMLDFPRIESGRHPLILSGQVDLVRLLFKHFGFCFDSIMYRTSALTPSDINDYHKKFFKWADRPYFIDQAKNGPVAVISEPLVHYRFHLGQDSQSEHGDKFVYLLRLYSYYKECLPQPLSKRDTKLFYDWSTNNLLLAISWFSLEIGTYRRLLRQCRAVDLFRWRHLGIRGLYYCLIVIRSMIKRFF